jgi:epoxyqueuosine reductase QueG
MSNLANSNYEYGIVSFSQHNINDFLKETPKVEIDWIKSMIVFVFPYQFNHARAEKYLTAKFSYGRDYHLILKDRLTEFIKKNIDGLNLSDYKFDILIDNSFFDEKKCAVFAGLGEIGKNNLLLNPSFGSRVVIGTIVTSKEFLVKRKIVTDICTNCDKCIKACPTNALDGGFNRPNCLSYLSQYLSDNYELYGKLRQSFGCDICQNVCPVNKTDYLVDGEFKNDKLSSINLEVMKELNSKTYKEYFKEKNFSWIGYLKMLRNILTLEVNNKNITIDELNYFQKKHQDVIWFKNHLEYLKAKLETKE